MSVHVYSPSHARGENNEETEEHASENWPNKKEIVYLNYQRYFINKMLRSFLAPKRAQEVRLWSVCPSVSLCTLCNKA